jgi:EAL domain-containing protein (putative c-di-GMP-specific phosphodiesterase class I)
VLHFQPIVAIETGAIIGCEALVRWEHPTQGLLPPTDFVGLTEETGLIVELGRWVLEQSCAQLRVWADAGHADLRVSVNVSARQLHEDSFVDDVRGALRRHRVRPERLVLELTESIFALDAAAISEQLRALRELGVRIAMDDFGTGYSSLSYLQKFQMDILKIDKAFVDPLGDGDPDSGALVSAIISLAHALRLEVVAEGIERPEQQAQLRAMGCRLGQGFLYSRPVEPAQLSALLADASGPVSTSSA